MKLSKFLLSAICALGVGFMSSCVSEEPISSSFCEIKLASTPKVAAYSNGYNLSATGSRSSENGYFERWQSDRSWEKPNDIIASEWEFVQKYLTEHPTEGVLSVDCNDFIIQVVGGGNHSYNGDTPDHNGAMHTVNNATNQMNQCYIDGFFTQFNNNGMNSENAIRIVNVDATNATYHDSYANLTQENLYKFYFITFPDEEKYGYMAGQTGCYLCYDYATYKDSEKWGVTADGIYDDWVIKLTKTDGTKWEVPSTTPTPEEGNGGDEDVTGPTEDKVIVDEVEVNLQGVEREDGSLESHLSIHVRAVTDVEIFIPVPMEYYCQADDMAIVMKHEPNHMTHGGPFVTEYKLKDSDLVVTLTVAFEDDGIRITTDGINEDVIAWCAEKCHGDGITFEVWNYFNEFIDLETLKGYLNQATIKFLDKTPDAYINAFADEKDCNVGIKEEQKDEYLDCVTDSHGCHSNGSNDNLIYHKK